MNCINNKMMEFIDNTPNAYYCVDNLKNKLLKEGYTELFEGETWNLKEDGKYFVIRNDSSLIAFNMTDRKDIGFNVVAAHTDSPSFTVKTKPEMYDGTYLKLNVSGYGGMLNYTWLDRPLSLAGRVITLIDSVYEKQLINIEKDMLIIPSQAIHINLDANEKNKLNHQVDLLPVMSIGNEKQLEDVIREELSKQGKDVQKICDYDLYLYNRDKSKYVGLNDEMILAPRLDDLGSLYPSFEAFIKSNNMNSIDVLCAFNNEEIGSLTPQGADSTFLLDILTRICSSAKIDLLPALNNTFVVSADNAHAIHPAAASKSDPTNKVLLNNGVVIKHHPNYTTDAVTSSIFKGICEYADVPVQDFACRSDMRCGATLGGISQSQVSVDSVDIGLPQLAMHSTNETIGSKDALYMYKAILEFYNSSIVKKQNKIKVLHK
mgnify:CR=1 FL=1